jgi:hypothetical protein
MPTVPMYNEQARPEALPGVRVAVDAPIDAFGAGKGTQEMTEAFSKVGQAAAKIAEQEKKKADELALMDADFKLSTLQTKLLRDPQNGALNKRGKDAFGTPGEVMNGFSTGADQIEGGLSNDEQKIAFRKVALGRMAEVDKTVQEHVAGQIKAYDDTTTDSYIANERNSAADNYKDPTAVANSAERQRQAIVAYAGRNGLPDEWVKQKMVDVESKTHVEVISRMLANGEDQLAKQYYEQVSPNISGGDKVALDKALEEGSLRGESQRKTDSILSKITTRQEAIDQAKQIPDPKVRDAVYERVNKEFDERREIENETRGELYLQSTNLIDANPGKSARDVIPPDTWSKLSLEQRNALQNRGENPVNDDKKWLDFLDLKPQEVGSLSRADFETKYWSHFDSSHRTRAETQWEAAKKSPDDPKVTNAITFKEQIDNTLRSAKLVDPSNPKKDDRDAAAYARFEQEAAMALDDFERNQLGGKRHSTMQEKQKILDDMVLKKVFVDQNWVFSNPQKPAALLSEDEKGKAYVKIGDVPTAERNQLENLLKSKGRKVTPQKIEQLMGAVRTGDRARFDALLSE